MIRKEILKMFNTIWNTVELWVYVCNGSERTKNDWIGRINKATHFYINYYYILISKFYV